MSKRSSGKCRRIRGRPLLVAAGAVTVMSVAGCGGFHGVLARCPPGQPSSDCVTVPDEPDLSGEAPADLGAHDLAHGSD